MAETRFRKGMKPIKYEMTKRREVFKAINKEMEKSLRVPLEMQPEVVENLVSRACYNNLCKMLDLPQGKLSETVDVDSVDTIIPYKPPEDNLDVSFLQTSKQASKESLQSVKTSSSGSLLAECDTITSLPSPKSSFTQDLDSQETITYSSEEEDAPSDFVEVEAPIFHDKQLTKNAKAIIKFLELPEEEAATWRKKPSKSKHKLDEMTLEEQGDFLTNKIAEDFCEWMKNIGGDDKSFISEEILKELFQIRMDNPASRAVCVKLDEKRVLTNELAEFTKFPDKAFHEVLALHLNWDARVEKQPFKLQAFDKGLPKDLRFKVPNNKTAETWLEWNKISPEQLSYADVYKSIKDLRSTKEYCKWLIAHPEHKRPQFLVESGMFVRKGSDPHRASSRPTSRVTEASDSTRASFADAWGMSGKLFRTDEDLATNKSMRTLTGNKSASTL